MTMSLCQKHPDCVAKDQVTHVCPLLDRVTKPAPPEVPAPDEVSETYPELDEVWIYIRDDGSLADALPAMKPSKPHHAAPPGAWVRYVRAREGGR